MYDREYAAYHVNAAGLNAGLAQKGRRSSCNDSVNEQS
jgi:hypothetical protein